MKKILICMVAAGLAGPAAAEFPVGKAGVNLAPSAKLDIDGNSDTGNGFGFYGEVGGDTLFVYGDYQLTSVDINAEDVDFKETRIGGGLRSGNDTGTLVVRVESYKAEIDSDSTQSDDSGVGVHVGGDVSLNKTIGLFGDLGFVSLDDYDGTEYRLGARANLTDISEVYGAYRMLSLDDSGAELDVSEFKLGINILF